MISLILVLAIALLLVCCVDTASLHDDHHSHRFSKSQKSAGKATCDPQFSKMFVFGDSLSDQGNFASVSTNPLFKPGFSTNGKFAVEYIADEFGLELQMSNHLVAGVENDLELITGTNYAVSGARTVPGHSNNTPAQVASFMAKHEENAPSDALYVVFVGGNDVVEASYTTRYRSDLEELFDPTITEKEVRTRLRNSVNSIIELIVQPLIDAGARNIVVVDAPPAQNTPFVTFNQPEERAENTERAVTFYNKKLKEAIDAVELQNDMNIVYYQGLSEVGNEGFQTTTPCVINFLGIPGADPSISPLGGVFTTAPHLYDTTCTLPDAPGFFYYDEFHPTTAIHELIAKDIVDQIRAEICPGKRTKSKSKYAKKSKSTKEKKSKVKKSKKEKK